LSLVQVQKIASRVQNIAKDLCEIALRMGTGACRRKGTSEWTSEVCNLLTFLL